ncbi:hypothetical protein C1Y40_01274 [Mycobacterium talmoniae]|uniref:Uncharacterized protein n=1 Tax=Mycobacterium talmoniae TaxID=1858794 RepID=A0A2S8BPB0_9MYCO|nr:hypothetical protein C1Y40_01274 [Mycobacterium talmoniae]
MSLAAPRPAARPEKMQPPRKVPSNARYAVHTAAAEPGHLPGRVQPVERAAVGLEYPGVQVGFQAAQSLSGQDVQLDRDQRPGLRVGQPVRGHHPAQPVAQIGAGPADRGDLPVLAEPVGHFAVAGGDLGLHRRVVQRHHIRQPIHRGDQLAQRVRADKVHPAIHERLHRRRRPGLRPRGQQLAQAASGQVRVLLLAGQREFLLDDLLVEHEPGVVVAGSGDVLQRAQGVETRVQRARQPFAVGVQPQRRRTRDDPDAVPGPHRVVVGDALGVVPHPVPVDHPGARGFGDTDHPTVHVRGHPGDQLVGHPAHPLRPVLPHQLQVAADAAAGHDHR